MDFAFGRYQNQVLPEIYTMADTDTFARALGSYWDGGGYRYDAGSGRYPDSLRLQGLLDFCLRVPEFRGAFASFCRELASEENTALLLRIIDECADRIDTELPYHIARWADTIASGYTYENWLTQVEHMREWAVERPIFFIEDLEALITKYKTETDTFS